MGKKQVNETTKKINVALYYHIFEKVVIYKRTPVQTNMAISVVFNYAL